MIRAGGASAAAEARPEASKTARARRVPRPPLSPDEIRMTKWVYSFSAGRSEGSASMKELLGGKGANLAEMAALERPQTPRLRGSSSAPEVTLK